MIDLNDATGRIATPEKRGAHPSGVSADYAMRVATYRLIAPRASGLVRLDTLVAAHTRPSSFRAQEELI